MMRSSSFILIPFTFLAVFLLLSNTVAMAQSVDKADQDTSKADAEVWDPQDQAAFIENLNKEKAMKQEAFNKELAKARKDAALELKDAKITFERLLEEHKNEPFPIEEVRGAVIDNVVATDLTADVSKNMTETASNISQGHSTDENSPFKDGVNPNAGIGASRDANYEKLLEEDFCIPESKNSSKACQARTDAAPPYEDFISFIIGEKPWQNKKVISAALLARRFFVGATERIFLNRGKLDIAVFMGNQRQIAKENFRASALNILAARRAPTSQSTQYAMRVLLAGLMPTGQIRSINQSEICTEAQKASMSIPEQYACSYKAAIGDKSLLSQSAIDRIFQYDYLLSGSFYKQINSGGTNSARKVQVWLKAQQLAQDYRGLRLLQMKTAMTAMNMMNGL